MLTTLSGINSSTGYQAQLNIPSNRVSGGIDRPDQSSSSQEKSDTVRISRQAKELEQVYQRKETVLEQNHNAEREKIEREYQQEKSQLEREFQQKKQALEVDLYI